MNNSNYNSLTQQLMQNGILPSNEQESDKNIDNFFEIAIDENAIKSSIAENVKIPKALQKKSKRLNQSDFEMVSENINTFNDNSLRLIKRFLNFKENLASKGDLGIIENLLFAFFPKLYRAKLVRDAMVKLKELNIDTNKLLEKTIPYGEAETRYESLIKYLSYANELHTKIKNKTN